MKAEAKKRVKRARERVLERLDELNESVGRAARETTHGVQGAFTFAAYVKGLQEAADALRLVQEMETAYGISKSGPSQDRAATGPRSRGGPQETEAEA